MSVSVKCRACEYGMLWVRVRGAVTCLASPKSTIQNSEDPFPLRTKFANEEEKSEVSRREYCGECVWCSACMFWC